MRLDFNTFAISGPSTDTNSIGKVIEGELSAAGSAACSVGQCNTDTFSVTGPSITPPVICGENSGEHSKIGYTRALLVITNGFLPARKPQAPQVNKSIFPYSPYSPAMVQSLTISAPRNEIKRGTQPIILIIIWKGLNDEIL